jgi:formate C-acetyltransferase
MMVSVSHNKYRVAVDRRWNILDDHPEYVSMSLPERQALAFQSFLRRQPVFIQDEELIVGGRTLFGPQWEAGQVEDTVDHDSISATAGESVDENTEHLDYGPHWAPAELVTGKRWDLNCFPHYTTKEERQAEKEKGYCPLDARPDNHFAPDYAHMLKMGLPGLKEQINNQLSMGASDEQRDYWKGMLIALDAMSEFCMEYSKLASEMAKVSVSTQRQQELKTIAKVCEHISKEAPHGLWEALQLYQFLQIFMLMEHASFVGPGRLDTNVQAFWDHSIKSGELNFDEARELLACFLIKLSDQTDCFFDDGLNIVIGGVDSEGNDVTTDLTYAALDATEWIHLASPQMCVRFHDNTPEKLYDRCTEVLATGAGMPIIINDGPYIKGLLAYGVKIEDARNYAIDTCEILALPGQAHVFRGAIMSLEIVQPIMEKLDRYENFEAFYDDIKNAYVELIHRELKNTNEFISDPLSLSPMVVKSLGFQDAVLRGSSVRKDGYVYNHTGLLIGGIINLVNIIAAVKVAVFEKKWVEARVLQEVLIDNWNGAEALRLKLKNTTPKWGNDDDSVDLICTEMMDLYADQLKGEKNPWGGSWIPGIYQHWQVQQGKMFGATADGREAFAPLAVNFSPDYGTDREGPTAILNSLSKVDLSKTIAENAIDFRFSPDLFHGAGKEAFKQFLKAFVGPKQGALAQINVLSTEMLKDAQKHPENYRDLVVRVWGFNAYFVELNQAYQQNIIDRTELCFQ